MRVALVHDYLKEYGGAERVLETLSEIYPEAPIYTAFRVPDSTAGRAFKNKKVLTSWANGFLSLGNLFSPLRFLTPLIWESFDFRGFDLVISSASWYITKSIKTPPETLHLCYCHTPPRWLYGYQTAMEWKRFWPVRIYGEIVAHFLRQYDYLAAQKVNDFIANSENTKKRIAKFYRRDSKVIYPPVKVTEIIQATKNLKPQDYFLVVARLAGAKGLELAIEAANRLKINLKIVGEPVGLHWEEKKLKEAQGGTIEFLGRVEDKDLWRLYGECRAFLALAYDEDFGMTTVEAQAAGRPVIAFRGGGYLETVIEGKTGEFFNEYTADSLINVLKHFDIKKYAKDECQKQAAKFSQERFKKEILEFVKEKMEAFHAGIAGS
ncbi:MAG: glycosyltransferase [Patescibacteria group bacterium]|nr:glycosyltransferase [Patescibacteria group bacterium]MCL5095731.1 glycosyltransferase [Patescibacteria group bacterium]